MKKLLLFTFTFFAFLPTVFAQEDTTKYWNWGGAGTINVGQIALSNWSAGGESSVNVLGIASLFANYKRGTSAWDNTLTVNYGGTKIGKDRFRKNDDKLELNAKYGRHAFGKWYYAGQLNVKTQLTPTYDKNHDSIVSDFLAPAFIMASLGLDYRPNENFSLFLSPATGKFTFVKSQRLADIGAFGVEPGTLDKNGFRIPNSGERFREEIGAYIAMRFQKDIMENIKFMTRLELYSSYSNNPENLDVNWQNKIDMKVNKFVSVSIITELIYDDDINIPVDRNDDGVMDGAGPRTQFKETLGVGLSYKF
jgi:hypothetical protein